MQSPSTNDSPPPRRLVAALLCCLCLTGLSGCAAITNPVANGIPARLLPPELLAESVEDTMMIPLNLLRRKPPEVYELASGDVLGVYVEGVLGSREQLPPVNFPEAADLPPSLGFPVPVREDGAVPLPLVQPVHVDGLSVAEAEQAIAQAYFQAEVLQPNKSVIVTLMRPRRVRVLVMRQDEGSGAGVAVQTGFHGRLRQNKISGLELGGGAGHIVYLPMGENDVLSALAETGGLPQGGAANEVVILRGYYEEGQEDLVRMPPSIDALHSIAESGSAPGMIRIPLRLPPGAPIPFTPQHIVLNDGDIMFIRQRTTGVYYTGGLLSPGQQILPRDADLRVSEAVAIAGGPLLSGLTIGSNLTGSVSSGGIGEASPTLLTIIRKTPGGGYANIRVDLARALQDPREDLIVQANDLLILQETADQAITRYATRVFNLSIFSEIIDRGATQGAISASGP